MKAVLLFLICFFVSGASFADLSVTEETSVMEVVNDHKRMGTAFAIDKVHLVTAYHVVEGEPVIRVVYRGKRYACSIVRVFSYWDIAVLRIHGVEIHEPLRFAETVSKGDEVIIYGFPAGFYYSRSVGVVYELSTKLMNWWDTRPAAVASANVRGGFSGGPVVNRKTNKVVGVLTNRESSLFSQDTHGIFTRCDQIRSAWESQH